MTITSAGTKLVVCMLRGGFIYGGGPIKFGDVIELRGLPNDSTLQTQGYFEEYNAVKHRGLTMTDGSDPADLIDGDKPIGEQEMGIVADPIEPDPAWELGQPVEAN